MGYTTEFSGSFAFNKKITTELKNYINAFSDVRHVKWNTGDMESIEKVYPDWKDQCWHGDFGFNGMYFVGEPDVYKQKTDGLIIDYNFPPVEVPGVWCDWIINDDGELVWNENEKFYEYIEWLEFLIKHFFEPEGYILNGSMYFRGEDFDDIGEIIVTDNHVEQKYFTNI